jgi:hypothetical protein
MKKQVPIFLGIMLLLTSTISAYSYNSVSIGEFFDTLGGENLGLIIIFLVSFTLLFTVLGRTGIFKENPSASTIISLMLSLGITYGLYRQGIDFNIDGIIYSLGVSEAVLDLIVFFGTVGLIILLLVKFRAGALLVLGGIIFALSMFGIINDNGNLLVIGIVMIIAWAIIKWFGWRLERTSYVKGMKTTNKFYKK